MKSRAWSCSPRLMKVQGVDLCLGVLSNICDSCSRKDPQIQDKTVGIETEMMGFRFFIFANLLCTPTAHVFLVASTAHSNRPCSDFRCVGGAVFVRSSPVCTRPPPAPQQMPAGLSGTYVWGPSIPGNLEDNISTSSFANFANSNVSFSRHVLSISVQCKFPRPRK